MIPRVSPCVLLEPSETRAHFMVDDRGMDSHLPSAPARTRTGADWRIRFLSEKVVRRRPTPNPPATNAHGTSSRFPFVCLANKSRKVVIRPVFNTYPVS